MSKEYRIPTNNHTELAVTVFSTTHPVGVVQVIHGALEHQSRYFDFAAYLNQQGFIVLTSDNRGHGRSVSKDDPLGVMFSWQQLVNDQVCLSHFITISWATAVFVRSLVWIDSRPIISSKT